MKWVSLGVQTLPVLSSETFEVWVTTDICPAVISLHFPSNMLCVFLQYQQQQKIFLTIFWKAQQAGSRCSVRDSIAILETTITICLQRKQWPTGRQQTHIVTAQSTPPWWDMRGLSCRRVGASSLHTKRASRQQEARVRQRILNRKANKIKMLSSFPEVNLWQIFLMCTTSQPLSRQAFGMRVSREGERL